MTRSRRLGLSIQLGLLAAAKCAVGGQAVLEGVLMRSPRALAIAVRKPDGTIAIKDEDWHSVTEKMRLLRLPFLRGMVMLFETMANGYQALTWAASQAFEDPKEKESAPAELSSWALAGTMVVALGIGMGLFLVVPHLATAWLNPLLGLSGSVESGSFHLVDGIIKLAIFVGYILLITRMPQIGRVFQYHGAEHKSIHVFEHAEPLDVEHTRKWPRLHPRCGTTFLLFVVLISALVFAAVFPLIPSLGTLPRWQQIAASLGVKLALMPVIAGISYEIIRVAGRLAEKPGLKQVYQPMMMLQRLTTKEPDDKQLEVALAALKAALAREEKLFGGPVTADRAVL
jgi:uncharacterized protein YqhQ